MSVLLDPCQGAFTKGRGAQDNAIVVLELFPSILTSDKRLNNDRPCFALKLDMAKAYDRLSWEFLFKVLQSFQFPDNFTSLIMQCVSSVSYAIMVNGFSSEYFCPSRGLQQGDLIFPLLFNLCIQYLSEAINF